MNNIPPFFLGTVRFILSTFPAIFFIKRPPVKGKLLIALTLTLTLNVGHFASLFLALKLGMPAGLSSIILQNQVFFTIMLSVFFLKEKWYWDNKPSALSIIPFALFSLYIEGFNSWVLVLKTLPANFIIAVLYLAFIATIIAFGLWGNLLSAYSPVTVTPFALLIPVFGLMSSNFFLGEKLCRCHIIGSLFVLFALFINVFGMKLLNFKKVSITSLEDSHNISTDMETIEGL